MVAEKERLPRELIAMRVAAELQPGEFVNLGIGIPNLVADFTSPEKGIFFHAENGILGIGKAQEVGKVDIPDLTNAGAIAYAHDRLRRLGVLKALARAGAQPGDPVRIGRLAFEYEPD